MKFSKLQVWDARNRLFVALLVAGGSACRETTTPKDLSTKDVPGAAFTLGAGITNTPVARGNLGAFQIKSKANGYSVELKSHDDTDIVVANVVGIPGATSGWHTHAGPAMVVMKTGALTLYHGDDPTCSPTVHRAGTSFIEEGGPVHIARNEGAETATWTTTYFVPKGAPTRIDAAAPGNCAF